MGAYKDAINKLIDEQIVDAMTKYFNVTPDLSDETWRATVLDYIRKDYMIKVDEDGGVSVLGDEHHNYFGEFVLFDYRP